MALQRNLLVLSSPLNQVIPKFKNYLAKFDDNNSTLYIHLTDKNKTGLAKIMTDLYQIQCHSIDLRLLLTPKADHLQALDQVYFEANMSENDKNSILNQLNFKGVQELPKIQVQTGAKILNLSENSHFQSLIFDKIHNFKVSFSQHSHFQALIFH